MKMAKRLALLASVVSVGAFNGFASATTLVDSMTNSIETGGLAGSTGDVVSSGETWTSYYYNNDGVLSPATGTLNTQAATFPAAGGSGIAPVTPTRGATGTNFGAYDTHTDDGAYIGVSPGSLSLITEMATVQLAQNSSTDGTAWGFIGLLNTDPGSIATPPPDVVAGATAEIPVSAWLLIRPADNTDYAELYATGGTGNLAGTLTSIPAADGGVWGLNHTISILYNPVAGTLNAVIDGTAMLSTPYSYGGSNPAAPTIMGAILGDRTNSPGSSGGNTTGVSPTDPSSVTFGHFSVTTAVPEPASLGVISMFGILAMRRRRSSSK